MKYKIKPTTRYKKDIKIAISRGCDLKEINRVINDLANDVPLDEKYKDHSLTGNWVNHRECHIQPDWLLIYQKSEENLILYLTRTGSHSDLY